MIILVAISITKETKLYTFHLHKCLLGDSKNWFQQKNVTDILSTQHKNVQVLIKLSLGLSKKTIQDFKLIPLACGIS